MNDTAKIYTLYFTQYYSPFLRMLAYFEIRFPIDYKYVQLLLTFMYNICSVLLSKPVKIFECTRCIDYDFAYLQPKSKCLFGVSSEISFFILSKKIYRRDTTSDLEENYLCAARWKKTKIINRSNLNKSKKFINSYQKY